jgi:prepilin-type processing-associated H-X9-DG protein
MGIHNSTTSTTYTGASSVDSGVLTPADLAVMWDSNNRWADCRDCFWTRDIAAALAKNYNYGARHSEMVNFLYYDGHVKADRWDKLKFQNVLNAPVGHQSYNQSIMITPPY